MSAPHVRLPFKGKHRLTQHFGERPTVYKRFGLPGHNGIDWSMYVGEAIVAVDDGKVVILKNDPTGFGLHIKLQHGWGQSLYAHLHQFQVQLHDTVKAGQTIALSGNSGFSSGPHLHFGLRVNPYKTNDGWYGYTNPHRFIKWRLPEIKEKVEPPPAVEPKKKVEPPHLDETILSERIQRLEKKLLEAEELVADQTANYQFERVELLQEADLWQETVTRLLERYMPGTLPREGDVLATLERLLQAWSEEVNTQRSEVIAGLFSLSK
ncbi:MAG: peptidoglycan DD-metalloendopeptidase family protein [Proteobacteria bacterium]|nr:peptidoglycan DD-metalloendopeptidase family protein [Pseudomonadota bacterium]